MTFGTTNMTYSPLIPHFGTMNIADSQKTRLGSLHCWAKTNLTP